MAGSNSGGKEQFLWQGVILVAGSNSGGREQFLVAGSNSGGKVPQIYTFMVE